MQDHKNLLLFVILGESGGIADLFVCFLATFDKSSALYYIAEGQSVVALLHVHLTSLLIARSVVAAPRGAFSGLSSTTCLERAAFSLYRFVCLCPPPPPFKRDSANFFLFRQSN